MTKRALIVGINDYTARWPSGSNNLSWCVNDAQSVYHMMVDAFGFDPSEIYFYTDQQASRRNILRALRIITLRGEPGDTAFFYYAGHGGRVPASASHGDVDLYYETICPASGDDISDWEIAEVAGDLEPSHVNFTVLLDSCHSGGMHSADQIDKVRSFPFSEDALTRLVQSAVATLVPVGLGLPAQVILDILGRNVRNVRRSAVTTDGQIDLDVDPDKTLVRQSLSTLIAGCDYDQTSREKASLGHGLLTQCLIDTVDTCPFEITYNELLGELRTRLAAYMTQYFPGQTQVPQLYGQQSRMDEQFLAGFTTSE
jgi:uncharacterized caspase-like protein